MHLVDFTSPSEPVSGIHLMSGAKDYSREWPLYYPLVEFRANSVPKSASQVINSVHWGKNLVI